MVHARLQKILVIVGIAMTTAIGQLSNAKHVPSPGNYDSSFCQTGQCTYANIGVVQPIVMDALQYSLGGKDYLFTFGRNNYSPAAETFITRHTPDGALDLPFGLGNQDGVVLHSELGHPLIPAHTGRVMASYDWADINPPSDFFRAILVVGAADQTEQLGTSEITRHVVALSAVSHNGYIVGPDVPGWLTVDFTPDDVTDIAPTSPFAKANGGYVSAKGQTIGVQSDKKVVIAAELTVKSTSGGSELQRLAVLRLMKNAVISTQGSVVKPQSDVLDASFGNGGKVMLPGSGSFIWDSVVQPDGKIVIAAQGAAGTSELYRLDPDGKLDATFGENGVGIVTAISGSGSLALQGDNKIVYGGTAKHMADDGQSSDLFVMCRLHATGVLDPAFGNAGCVQAPIAFSGQDTSDVPYAQLEVGDIVIQANGKSVIAATFGNAVDKDIVTVRFNANGTLDSTFAQGPLLTGLVITGFDANGKYNYEGGRALVLQNDGRIIVGGYVDNYAVEPTAKIFLQRLYGDHPKPALSIPTDVALTMQGIKSVAVGTPFHYSIFIENLGPYPAEGVKFVDNLPVNGILKQIISPPGMQCNQQATVVTCTAIALPVGQKVKIILQINSSTVGQLINAATVSVYNADFMPSNNSASMTTQVVPEKPPVPAKKKSPRK